MPRPPSSTTISAGRRKSGAERWEDQVVELVYPELAREYCLRLAAKPPPDDQRLQQACDDAMSLLFELLLFFYAQSRDKLSEVSQSALSSSNLGRELAAIGGDDFRERSARFKGACGGGAGFRERLRVGLTLLEPFRFPTTDRRANARRPRKFEGAKLAWVIDGLLRVWDKSGEAPEFVDYAQLSTRHLGAIYERLLDFRIDADAWNCGRRSPQTRSDRARRKASGSFYTPQPIIDQILEGAVGPALDQWFASLERELWGARSIGGRRAPRHRPAATEIEERFCERLCEFRVLDPAMGAGHFLVAASDFIAEKVCQLAACRNGGSKSSPDDPTSLRMPRVDAIKRRVIERCLWGIDVDPRAVRLAQARLWLETPTDGASEGLERRLRCGDALQSIELEDFPRPGEFAAVIGNPPYGVRLKPSVRRDLARKLPLMKTSADTAAGFIERASQWAGAAGRVGLIVPKPLTYSFAWREVRRFLHGRLERLVDVSRAWSDVRLEQAIVIFHGGVAATRSYQAAWIEAGHTVGGARMPWTLADRFQTLPCALTDDELERLASLKLSDETVGDVCRTFRGLPAQRWLSGERCGQPVIGGRDLERWRIRSSSGKLSAAAPFSTEMFAREKLVFQNIIAHVKRPRPRILLIGAYDSAQSVTLDTVNNLVPAAPGMDLLGLLGLLHSELVNWLVYAAVYNKAVRTMHFDQYFLKKIPLPEGWQELLERLAVEVIAARDATARLHECLAQFAGVAGRQGENGPARTGLLQALLEDRASSESRAGGKLRREAAAEAKRLAEMRRQAEARIDRLTADAYGAVATDAHQRSAFSTSHFGGASGE